MECAVKKLGNSGERGGRGLWLEEKTKVKGKVHCSVLGADVSVWDICGVGGEADRSRMKERGRSSLSLLRRQHGGDAGSRGG